MDLRFSTEIGIFGDEGVNEGEMAWWEGRIVGVCLVLLTCFPPVPEAAASRRRDEGMNASRFPF